MKDLFDASQTNGVHTGYLGADNTEGFRKRVHELTSGSYKAFTGLSPTAGTNQAAQDVVLKAMGTYHDAFLESSGENTIYQFWQKPLIEFALRKKGVPVQSLSVEIISGVQRIKVTTSAEHGLLTSDKLVFSEFTSPRTAFNSETDVYVDIIDSTNFYLMDDASGPTDYDLALLDAANLNTITIGSAVGNNITPNNGAQSRAIRYDGSGSQGSVVRFDANPNFTTGDKVRLNAGFEDAAHSGTLDSAGTDFFVESLGGSNYSWQFFTDQGRTTPATIAETYTTSKTRNYTSAGTLNLTSQAFSDWGISGSAETDLETEVNGHCRIIATVTQGTFTGKSASPETIPTSINYSGTFYYRIDSSANTFSIFDKRSASFPVGSTAQDFILADAGSGVDVTLEIKFIKPGRTAGGYSKITEIDITNDTSGVGFVTNENNQGFEVDTATIHLPGNEQYQYQNASNATTAGVQYKSGYWLSHSGSGEISQTSLQSGEAMPNRNTIILDSNARLSTFTFPSGRKPSDDRGKFDAQTTRMFELEDFPDEYSAPAVTAAAQEDVFDMDTEWDSAAFDNTKNWPDHILPSNAIWTYNQPNQTSVSQNGTKYVRNFGVNKWQLEVTYPPMLKDDFRLFHSKVLKAKGQFHPFYFNIKKSSNYWLFGFNNLATNPSPIRFKSVSSTQVLVEGFDPGFGPVPEGSLIIAGANNNGQLHTITNEEDANLFGEIKFRFAYAPSSGISAGDQVYLKPSHMVVTLSEDGFEYNVDTAGRYQFTVKFDLDEFK